MGFGENLQIALNSSNIYYLYSFQLASLQQDIILIESPGCTKCAAAERIINDFLEEDPNPSLTKYYYYSDAGHRIIKEKGLKGIYLQ